MTKLPDPRCRVGPVLAPASRRLFPPLRKRRELLLDASHCAASALAEYFSTRVGPGTRPGIVVLIATSGDLLQWHPHGHILAADGTFSDEGAFHPLETWDPDAIMKLFRERLLARLIECHAISEELARKLLAWRHPGFSAHVGEAIPFEDRKAIEDVACYMVRAPLSLKKLVYLDGQKAVLYRSRMNPYLGRNFEAMDPLEWLARLADQYPRHGQAQDPFLRLLRQSGPSLPKRERGLRSPGRGSADEEALSAELGAAHQQGVPGGPPRVQRLRRSAQDRGVHHR